MPPMPPIEPPARPPTQPAAAVAEQPAAADPYVHPLQPAADPYEHPPPNEDVYRAEYQKHRLLINNKRFKLPQRTPGHRLRERAVRRAYAERRRARRNAAAGYRPLDEETTAESESVPSGPATANRSER